MKIAIIGTGNMGTGLANVLATTNHDIVIASRNSAKAQTLAKNIGAESGCIETAVKSAEMVILALPYQAVKEVLLSCGDLTDKILIDITNPVTQDFKELLIGHVTSGAEEIQALAPKAKIVKAFNTIFAQLLPTSARTKQTLQVFIASDDDNAKTVVSNIANSIGFEPIDAGSLCNSRFIEPIGAMNIHFAFFFGQGPTVAPIWVKA